MTKKSTLGLISEDHISNVYLENIGTNILPTLKTYCKIISKKIIVV